MKLYRAVVICWSSCFVMSCKIEHDNYVIQKWILIRFWIGTNIFSQFLQVNTWASYARNCYRRLSFNSSFLRTKNTVIWLYNKQNSSHFKAPACELEYFSYLLASMIHHYKKENCSWKGIKEYWTGAYTIVIRSRWTLYCIQCLCWQQIYNKLISPILATTSFNLTFTRSLSSEGKQVL